MNEYIAIEDNNVKFNFLQGLLLGWKSHCETMQWYGCCHCLISWKVIIFFMKIWTIRYLQLQLLCVRFCVQQNIHNTIFHRIAIRYHTKHFVRQCECPVWHSRYNQSWYSTVVKLLNSQAEFTCDMWRLSHVENIILNTCRSQGWRSDKEEMNYGCNSWRKLEQKTFMKSIILSGQIIILWLQYNINLEFD